MGSGVCEACARINSSNISLENEPSYRSIELCSLSMNLSRLNVSRDVAQAITQGPSMLTRFVAETVIAMPLSGLGLIGNILAVVVLLRQRPRLTTSVLLIALAVADCMVLLLTILLRSMRYLSYFTGHVQGYLSAYHYIFITLYPSTYFIRLVDTWLIVLLTIDRYIVVCHPLKAQASCTIAKTRRNILILVVVSAIFCLPRYFEHKLDYSNPFKFSQTQLTENAVYTVVYRVLLYLIVMYMIPTLTLVVLNVSLLKALRVAERQRMALSNGGTPCRGHGRSITAIVVTVVTISILSNTVALLSHLLWSLQLCFEQLSYLELPRRYTSLLSNIFITFNSAINFLIYVFCSRSFRLHFLRTCNCTSCSNQSNRVNGSVLRMGTFRSEVSHCHSGKRKTGKQPSIRTPEPSFV